MIVPGHGKIGNNQSIEQMIGYILKINSLVDDAIKTNEDNGEPMLTKIPEEYKNWWFSRFFAPNLSILYSKKTEPNENE